MPNSAGCPADLPADRVLPLRPRVVRAGDSGQRLAPPLEAPITSARSSLRGEAARATGAAAARFPPPVGIDDRVDQPDEVGAAGIVLVASAVAGFAGAEGRAKSNGDTSTAMSVLSSVTQVVSAVWIGHELAGAEAGVRAAAAERG